MYLPGRVMVTERQRRQGGDEVTFVVDVDDANTLVDKVRKGLIPDARHAKSDRIDGDVHRGLRR